MHVLDQGNDSMAAEGAAVWTTKIQMDLELSEWHRIYPCHTLACMCWTWVTTA